jgi:lipoprotein-releasing system permease protein
MFINYLFIGLKYAKSDKHNNFLSKLGIVFGISITIVILSTINGFKEELENKLLNKIDHVEYSEKYLKNGLKYEEEYIRYFKQNKNVKDVIKYSDVITFVKNKKKHEIFMLLGINESAFDFYNFNKNSDCFFEFKKPDTICLTSLMQKELDVKKGDKIKVLINDENKHYYKKFEFIGIFNNNFNKGKHIAISNEENIKKIFKRDYSEGIRIKIKEPFKAIEFARKHSQNISEIVEMSTWDYLFKNIYRDMYLVKILSYVVLFFIVVISLLNMISNLTINLKQKEKEIKMFKNFGYSKNQIKNIFLISVMFNYFKSLVISIIIGILITLNIESIMNTFNINPNFINTDLFSSLPVSIAYIDILIIFVVTFTLNLVLINLFISKFLKD